MAGLLTLSSMLPFGNATAQEPAVKSRPPATATLTAHHATAPTFTRAESPFESAKPDAENNDRIAFWIVLPEGARYSPEDAGQILVAQMAQRGVPARAFGRTSPSGSRMTVNVHTPSGVYASPLTKTTNFDLRSIIPQLDIIAEQYLKIHSSDRVAINKSGPESAP